MKILETKEFARLPKGTLFSLCGEWSLGNLCVKEETLAYWDNSKEGVGTEESFSYVVIRLSTIEQCSVTDETENLPITAGIQFPMNFAAEKCEYQPHELFAVWEKEDIENLLGVAGKAIEAQLGNSLKQGVRLG